MGSNPGNQKENSNNKHRLSVSYNDIVSLRLMRISEVPIYRYSCFKRILHIVDLEDKLAR